MNYGLGTVVVLVLAVLVDNWCLSLVEGTRDCEIF
jgi:hypothetical protein